MHGAPLSTHRSGMVARAALTAMVAAGALLGGLVIHHGSASAEGCERRCRAGGDPNLVITGFDQTGNPGERKLTVQNIGTGMALDFNVYIRDTQGRNLWNGRSSALLGYAEAQTFSWTLNIGGFPCAPATIIVDPEDAVIESDPNSSSNTMTMMLCPKLDLAVKAVVPVGGAKPDHVDFAVSNVGEGNAGKFVVQATGDMGFSQTLYFNSLAAGASQTFSLSDRQPGETVRIVADPGNTLFDYDQLNNLAVSPPPAAS